MELGKGQRYFVFSSCSMGAHVLCFLYNAIGGGRSCFGLCLLHTGLFRIKRELYTHQRLIQSATLSTVGGQTHK